MNKTEIRIKEILLESQHRNWGITAGIISYIARVSGRFTKGQIVNIVGKDSQGRLLTSGTPPTNKQP